MVKVMMIMRKTDGLIFCENNEECSEDQNLNAVRAKCRDMHSKFRDKKGDYSLNIDSQKYMIQ